MENLEFEEKALELAKDYTKILEEKGNLENEIFLLKSNIEAILEFGAFTDSERINSIKEHLKNGTSEIYNLYLNDTPF